MAAWSSPAEVGEMAEFTDLVRTFLVMSPDPHVDIQAQLQMTQRAVWLTTPKAIWGFHQTAAFRIQPPCPAANRSGRKGP